MPANVPFRSFTMIKLNKNFALAYYNRSEMYKRIGKNEEAENDMKKALELDPKLKEKMKES